MLNALISVTFFQNITEIPQISGEIEEETLIAKIFGRNTPNVVKCGEQKRNDGRESFKRLSRKFEIDVKKYKKEH